VQNRNFKKKNLSNSLNLNLDNLTDQQKAAIAELQEIPSRLPVLCGLYRKLNRGYKKAAEKIEEEISLQKLEGLSERQKEQIRELVQMGAFPTIFPLIIGYFRSGNVEMAERHIAIQKKVLLKLNPERHVSYTIAELAAAQARIEEKKMFLKHCLYDLHQTDGKTNTLIYHLVNNGLPIKEALEILSVEEKPLPETITTLIADIQELKNKIDTQLLEVKQSGVAIALSQ